MGDFVLSFRSVQQDFGLVIIVLNREEYQERRKVIKRSQSFLLKQIIM